jgi:hypothetical protein
LNRAKVLISTFISSITLSVVRCVLTEPKSIEDWKRTVIVYISIKYGEKGCKVIIDGESCINAVSYSCVTRLGLKYVPYTKLYNVSWVNNQWEMFFSFKVCKLTWWNLMWWDFYGCRTCPFTFERINHFLFGKFIFFYLLFFTSLIFKVFYEIFCCSHYKEEAAIIT